MTGTTHDFDHRRTRRRAGVVAATVVLAGVAAAASPSTTWAAAPRVSGTVVLDTNADGTINGSTQNGLNEPGFSAVTIELVCTADESVLATATAAADGSYAMEDLAIGSCASGSAFVRTTGTDNRYSITDGAGADNDTPRVSPQVGQSAPFALTAATDQTVDTLVRPDWYLDLTIPTSSGLPAVFTGSGPFDTADPGCPASPAPGNDCAAQDLVVRNQDTVTFNWAVSASSLNDLAPTAGDVVLEQTLDLDPDGPGGNPPSVANFDRVPARCRPEGGGGTPPPTSRIVAHPSETVVPTGGVAPAGTTSLTLVCNLGVWTSTGSQVLLDTVAKISGESPNGSQLSTSARVYGVDDANVPTMVPPAPKPYGPIEVTAVPRYDLEKRGFFGADPFIADLGTGLGPEPGYLSSYVVQISTDRRVGVEALAQPITITDDIYGFLPDGVTAYPGMEYRLLSCGPNQRTFPGTVAGATAGSPEPNRAVTDSGTCALTRNNPADATSDYTMTFDGIDMSGNHYPTQNASGTDLSAGPFYVASYYIEIFVPLRVMDAADGVVGDGAGSVVLYNRVGGFDPSSAGGTSNYAAGVEPGSCTTASVDGNNLNAPGMPFCDPMPGGGRSNNVIGPHSLTTGDGFFDKHILDVATLYGPVAGTPAGSAGGHDGQGVAQPGQVHDTYVEWRNRGVAQWHGSTICDVFDNTVARLAPSIDTVTGGTSSIYAFLNTDAPGDPAAYNTKWIFEYAHIDLTGDDPLSGGTINPATSRYDGTWTNQAAARCDDTSPANGTWYTDPNAAPGGIDEVNAVRVRPGIDPDTGQPTTQPFGVINRLVFGMEIRDTFYSGPHAGNTIPAGTVFANYGGAKADEQANGQWTGRGYLPSPENTATDGDRLTITRSVLAIQKRTITVDGVGDGAADFGATGAAVAGNPIVWEIVASLSADTADPAPVDNLRIVDVLPPYVAFDLACTLQLPGGTPPDVVLDETPGPGQTTLIWNLGTWTPNTPIPNRRICTISDPLAPPNTSLVNRTEISADSVVGVRFDTHTVTLEQAGTGQSRKTVDSTIDLVNDEQRYELAGQNFSQTLIIDAPIVLEVFPYNGDGTPPGGANRNPPSVIHGALELTAAPTITYIGGGAYSGQFLYTADAPATINQDLNFNTSTWCSETAGVFLLVEGAGPCPTDFASVTGFKMIGADDLTPFTAPDTSGYQITFTLQAGDPADPFSATANHPNDVYSNRFVSVSDTYRDVDGNYLNGVSNRTTLYTVGHSVGDLVFDDVNLDGRYTEGTDLLVPDGVPVDLWYVPPVGAPDAGVARQVKSTTTAGGTYLFTMVPSGEYYVEIAASAFAPGGLLDGWAVSPTPASDDVDENDDISHDAIPGSAGAVISNRFTLSYAINPATGNVTNGEEPLGENIHGVIDATVVDAASNLAIDLALYQPPTGTITLLKQIVDPAPGDDLGDAGTFPITVTCTPEQGDAVVTDIALPRDGTPVTVDGLPLPSTCTVVETDPDGGTPAYTPSATIELTDTAPMTVTVTNTYPDTPPTTTEPPTTAPPTTAPPTSTAPPPVAPPAPPVAPTAPDPETLPATGSNTLDNLLIAAAFVALGTLMLTMRRRGKPARTG